MAKFDKVWNTGNIETVKQRIKTELDDLGESKSLKERLTRCLDQIKALQNDTKPESLLDQYVYAMSALVQHGRAGGLKDPQIRNLQEIIFLILSQQNIDQGSRLAFLWEDFHLVESQVSRFQGKHWESAWQQQLSARAGGRTSHLNQHRQLLATALRSMRLGHGTHAINTLQELESIELPDHMRIVARLNLILGYRLFHCIDEAREVVAKCEAMELPEHDLKSLEWEKICLEVADKKDYGSFVQAVGAKGDFHYSGFFLEGVLWLIGAGKKDLRSRLPLVKSARKKQSLDVSRAGYLYDSATIIDQCFDDQVNLDRRLNDLGTCLARREILISIEQELLVLASAARWLAEVQIFPLASLCLREYRGTSLRFTDAKHEDCLGIAEELMSRNWFQLADIKENHNKN